jgi:hypothetical protein
MASFNDYQDVDGDLENENPDMNFETKSQEEMERKHQQQQRTSEQRFENINFKVTIVLFSYFIISLLFQSFQIFLQLCSLTALIFYCLSISENSDPTKGMI